MKGIFIGEKRGTEWEKIETNHERLLTLENKQGVVEGRWVGGWDDWVTGTEGGTWWVEHWVLHYMLANQIPEKTTYNKKKKMMTKDIFVDMEKYSG